MIRFQPDTWRDILWRPLAMAAPDAGVYVETMAPDVRFAALLLLTLAGVLVGWRQCQRPGVLAALLAFTWLAFVSWLATSGNGRYFMPVLLLAGPLCIALIQRLPMTAYSRMAWCVLLVTAQVAVVASVDPRRQWSLISWSEPYFKVHLTAAERDQPAAWVMITSLSYSFVAPQFDSRSRWINVSGLRGAGQSVDDDRAQRFLAAAVRDGLPLRLLLPVRKTFRGDSGQPVPALRVEIDRSLQPFRLALAGSCEVRRSAPLARQVGAPDASSPSPEPEVSGFWVCLLRYPVDPPPTVPPTPQELLAGRVFERLEQQCPRLFPSGDGRPTRLPEGFERNYVGADMHAYVTDDGQVRFKYWRALSPNLVGTVEEVLSSGFRLDCNSVRGRSGLPWERKL